MSSSVNLRALNDGISIEFVCQKCKEVGKLKQFCPSCQKLCNIKTDKDSFCSECGQYLEKQIWGIMLDGEMLVGNLIKK